MKMRCSRLATALGLAALTTGVALAQPRPATPPVAPTPVQAPAPPANPDSPERTTAVFGDWTVQCAPRPPGSSAGPGRICEMIQGTQNQQQQPISVLALGRISRTDPLRLVARLPVNALVSQPVRITMEGGEPLVLPFHHCSVNPVGCFAEIELRDETVLRRLRARPQEQPAKLEFKEPGGQDVAIPVSFRGFNAAFEALSREPG